MSGQWPVERQALRSVTARVLSPSVKLPFLHARPHLGGKQDWLVPSTPIRQAVLKTISLLTISYTAFKVRTGRPVHAKKTTHGNLLKLITNRL